MATTITTEWIDFLKIVSQSTIETRTVKTTITVTAIGDEESWKNLRGAGTAVTGNHAHMTGALSVGTQERKS